MLNTTLSRLRCPLCASALDLRAEAGSGQVYEVRSGGLGCRGCQRIYPILAGVAILVSDPEGYILEHVKGVAQAVSDEEIPESVRDEYLEAKSEIESEHIEEDLEAERVVSLYLMNHFLTTREGGEWWKAEAGASSPLIDRLVREHWDQGPLARISGWIREGGDVVELGCGVAGLARMLRGRVGSYLGVDSSFASVALGRHLVLGVPYAGSIRIPGDLLQGPVSRLAPVAPASSFDGAADLVVGDIERLPVERGAFDACVVLNAIDMLPEPAVLPALQYDLLKKGGEAIQSCPYIWHEVVARALRAELPAGVRDSAAAVEWLYERAGLEVRERVEHLPWLFFKHVRQLEIYSAHVFRAARRG